MSETMVRIVPQPERALLIDSRRWAVVLHHHRRHFFFFSSRRRHTRSVSAFLLNRSSDLFVCLSMVQLMAVFISMRCTLCGHFLQVALTLILVVGYAIAAS